MECETNDCRKEKRGCKGCYYGIDYAEGQDIQVETKIEVKNKKDLYLKKLIEIQEQYGDDEEVRHVKEDDLLCDLLNDLNYGEIVQQYNETNKWYA